MQVRVEHFFKIWDREKFKQAKKSRTKFNVDIEVIAKRFEENKTLFLNCSDSSEIQIREDIFFLIIIFFFVLFIPVTIYFLIQRAIKNMKLM